MYWFVLCRLNMFYCCYCEIIDTPVMKKLRQLGFGLLALGGATFATAQENALEFNGSTDYVTIPNSTSINTSIITERSVEVWFKVDDKSLASKQVIYEEGGSTRGLSIYIESSTLYFGGWNNSASESNWTGTYLTTTDFESGRWYYAAITLDGETTVTANTFRAYLNGEEIGSGDGSQLWEHSGNISIGRSGDSSLFHDGSSNSAEGYFGGQIDELRIWNSVRTAGEVLSDMNASLTGSETDLEAFYDFNASSGSTLSDQTSNSHDGTITSASFSSSYAQVNPVVAAETGTTQDATNTTFTANWSAPVSGVTPTTYYLDVSSSSDFSTFISGYDNLNVGNTTSQAVNITGTLDTYYYRVRAGETTAGESASSDTEPVAVVTIGAFTVNGSASDYAPTVGSGSTVTFTVKSNNGLTDTAFTGSHDVTVSGYEIAPDTSYGSFVGTTLTGASTVVSLSFTSGVASGSLVLHKADAQTVSFSVADVTTGSVSGVSDFIPVGGSASNIEITTNASEPQKYGDGLFIQQPSIRLLDTYGNYSEESGENVTASKLSGTGDWSITGGASLVASSVDGIVTFSGIGATNSGTTDETAAQVRYSYNGNNLDGTAFRVFGSPVAPANALTLDGVNEYVLFPDTDSINSTTVTSRTIELWFRADDPSIATNQVIFDEGGATRGFAIYIRSNTLYVGGWNDSATESNWTGTYLSTTDISPDTWHHVALVLDNAGTTVESDKLIGYLDGKQFAIGSGSQLWSHNGDISLGANTDGLHDDGNNGSLGNYFGGDVDDLRIWSVARSEGEIRTGMYTNMLGNETGLVGLFRMDQTTGNTLYDYSDTRNHGTLQNTENTDWQTSDLPYGWTGGTSTAWDTASNWEAWSGTTPTAADDIKIHSWATNQPTINSSAVADNTYIQSGAVLNIDVNQSLNLSGQLTIAGAEGLTLQASSSGAASLLDNGTILYRDNGTASIETYLNGSLYHYIGSPVDTPAKFTDMIDLYSYRETDLTWLHHSGFSNFTNGQGYAIRYSGSITKTFTGELNTGDVTVPITRTTNGGNIFQYYNIVSNPYPSAIDVDAFVDANSSMAEITVHFWNGVDYATFNTSLGAGTSGTSSTTPDGNIAPGQSFMVEAKTAGSVTFTNAMRNVDGDIFYRKEAPSMFRVMLSGDDRKSDVLIAEHADATNGIDDFDSKLLKQDDVLAMYAEVDGKPYAIQTFGALSEDLIIDLTVQAGQTETYDFDIDRTSLDGNKEVYLEDTKTGIITPMDGLHQYSCVIEEGVHQSRFRLLFKKPTVVSEAFAENVVVNFNGNELQLINNKNTITSVEVFSIDGSLILSENGANNKWDASNWSKGVYMIKVGTTNGVSSHKCLLL